MRCEVGDVRAQRTPPVPEEATRTARVSAEARHRQFVEDVSEQFSGGKRFLDDVPREECADATELNALARDTEVTRAKKTGAGVAPC